MSVAKGVPPMARRRVGFTFAVGAIAVTGLLMATSARAGTYVKQKSFNVTNGLDPQGVVVSQSGDEYGVAEFGGFECPVGPTEGCGVVFKRSAGGMFQILETFNGASNGAFPALKPTLSNGVLYGTTELGGASNYGVVFKLNTDGSGFQLMHSFADTDGGAPFGSVVLDTNTNRPKY